MAMEYFPWFHSYADKLRKLSDSEVGRLVRALSEYSKDGTAQELNGREQIAFDFIADDIDRAKTNYQYRCETNRNNAKQKQANASDGKQTQANEPKPNTNTNTNTNTNLPLTGEEERAEEPSPSTPPPITLPMNDGSEFPVTQEKIDEFSGLYPAVDVMQQLRAMRGWLLSNPDKRKTKRGINAFINRWLSKEQDRGGRTNRKPPNGPTYKEPEPMTAEQCEQYNEKTRKLLELMKGGEESQ